MNFFGIVEDRNDPLKIGRVRVRCHGIHTDDKQLIATPDLPWAQVILPTTSAGLSGIGTQHGLIEGSTVFGFFRDGELCQDPVVTGVAVGIPPAGYRETVTDELLIRNTDKGFNDPRKLTSTDYDGTPDGKNPEQSPQRVHGLTAAMDSAPKAPKDLTLNYDATGSTITEETPSETMLPWYPLYTEESDVSSIARGTTLDHKLSDKILSATSEDGDNTTEWNDLGEHPKREEGKLWLDSVAAPVYPYNKVLQTESGHVVELDDTPTKERINIHHRSGTFHEIHPDGSEVTRIVNDKWEVVAKDNKIFIAGNADLTIEKGHVTININTGNVDMKVLKGNVTSEITEGNLKADILTGTTDVLSEGKITITGNNTTEIISDTTITGTLHVTKAQTNASTIHAVGDIDTEAGNAPTLATHKHKYDKPTHVASSVDTKKPS